MTALMTGDLHNIELMELAARIRAGDVSPVSVIRAQLDRIAALDGKLAYYGQVIAVDGGFTIGGLLG